MFHSGDNCCNGAILDDLPIKINVFSHVCILRNDLNWTDAVIWYLVGGGGGVKGGGVKGGGGGGGRCGVFYKSAFGVKK